MPYTYEVVNRPGELIEYTTAPAAGADLIITVPAGFVYRLIGGQFRFQTSVVVANRIVQFEYRMTAAGLAVSKWRRNGNHVGGELKTYYMNPLHPVFETSISNDIYLPAFPATRIPAGGVFRTNIINLDAGDVISNLTFQLEVWRA